MWKTRLNMAALVLAILHIIVGPAVSGFSFSAGVEYSPASASQVNFSFWSGAWMCLTGLVGIPGTREERSKCRDAFALCFMLFSIASAVFGGVIVVLYSMTIASNEDLDWGEIGIKAVLGLGIVEFLIGMWAAVCTWLILKPFKNCSITTGSSDEYCQPGLHDDSGAL